MSTTRACPFCAETIQAQAVICRFCNRDLAGSLPNVTALGKGAKSVGGGGFNRFATWVGIYFLCSWIYTLFIKVPAPLATTTPASVASTLAAAMTPNRVELSPQKVIAVAHGKFGLPALKGKITNTTGRDLSYVEVTAEFSNKSGKVIATGLDNQVGLAKGETWHFEVLWPQDVDAESAKIIHATGQ